MIARINTKVFSESIKEIAIIRKCISIVILIDFFEYVYVIKCFEEGLIFIVL